MPSAKNVVRDGDRSTSERPRRRSKVVPPIWTLVEGEKLRLHKSSGLAYFLLPECPDG